MLLGGDEMGRTQQGNNNAYCQDNEITWFDWANADTALTDFTRNLVAYDDKHNEANGEGNQDGESHNRSWNGGAEGETDDPEINALRERRQRNFLATLLLSQGVPMLLGGDEMDRTQQGNNNAYCQDNALTWFDWTPSDRSAALLRFTRRLIALRRRHPVLHRRRWFQGRAIHGSGVSDVVWLRPDGQAMTDEEWAAGFAKSLAVFLNGCEITWRGDRGERVVDDSFLLVFNAHHDALDFTLPGESFGRQWEVVLDTAAPDEGEGDRTYGAGAIVRAEGRSVVVLRRPR